MKQYGIGDFTAGRCPRWILALEEWGNAAAQSDAVPTRLPDALPFRHAFPSMLRSAFVETLQIFIVRRRRLEGLWRRNDLERRRRGRRLRLGSGCRNGRYHRDTDPCR